ncbi:MAG: hypothetical protein EBZ77_13530, partial [Chitinophagia bacterium]|nr:hypothetical protein [Chitinophagia bacterium]
MQTSTDGSSWSGNVSGSVQSYSSDGANAVVNPPTTTSMSVSLSGLSIAVGSGLYLRWSFTGSGGSSNAQGIGLDNLSVTATFASSGCSGTPSHATATATPASLCSGNTTGLALSGHSTGTGYTYQWQQATTAASGPYSSISGATNATYT